MLVLGVLGLGDVEPCFGREAGEGLAVAEGALRRGVQLQLVGGNGWDGVEVEGLDDVGVEQEAHQVDGAVQADAHEGHGGEEDVGLHGKGGADVADYVADVAEGAGQRVQRTIWVSTCEFTYTRAARFLDRGS